MTNLSNPQCRRLNESLFVSKALPLRCHRLVTEPSSSLYNHVRSTLKKFYFVVGFLYITFVVLGPTRW